MGHPPSLFPLVRVELELRRQCNIVRLFNSLPRMRIILRSTAAKVETNVTNASTHMLSLVVSMIGSSSGLMNAPRSDRFEDAEDVGSAWPADLRTSGTSPGCNVLRGALSAGAVNLGWAWSRRRCSVVHSASSRLAVLAHTVAFIARSQAPNELESRCIGPSR